MKWISKIFFLLTSIILRLREIMLFGRGMIYYINYGDISYGWWSFQDGWSFSMWAMWQLFLACFFLTAATNFFAKN
jgi:hypothetical protein